MEGKRLGEGVKQRSVREETIPGHKTPSNQGDDRNPEESCEDDFEGEFEHGVLGGKKNEFWRGVFFVGVFSVNGNFLRFKFLCFFLVKIFFLKIENNFLIFFVPRPQPYSDIRFFC